MVTEALKPYSKRDLKARSSRELAEMESGESQALLGARPQGALCLKRGRHAHRRGHEGVRRGDDALPD